ncbi:MAG: phosphoribosylaminoimidazolesuccinocarboxamide synthase [Patescibacteria group bacterium]
MPEQSSALLRSDLPGLELLGRGKVRDVYAVDENRILFVASDRISAFDVVMPNGIPDKGRVLTQISQFWFGHLPGRVTGFRHHMLDADINVFPTPLQPYCGQLEGRSMIVKRLNIIPIECIVRRYLAGGGWKEYQRTGGVCGNILFPGLRESDRLPQPIFTPTTKAEIGHDENISPATAVGVVDKWMTDNRIKCDMSPANVIANLAELSIEIYSAAAAYAGTRGIIIADTKFEFGIDPIHGNIVLADEVLTPDSSRFWDMERYEPGRPQDSFDKQYLRDYLETLGWNKEPPAPTLPEEVVMNTRAKYLEAYHRITGTTLAV